MSLSAALNSSVSALRAQSAAIAAVSENIANASTTAYKTQNISFQSLVTGKNTTSSGSSVGGSVTYSTSQNMTEQGSIQITSVTTNIAISGQGFFVVTDDVANQPAGYQYSRNGNFSTNEDGLLVNDEGMILLAWPTDGEGNVTAVNQTDLTSLDAVDVGAISGTAQSTTEVDYNMNLPADAEVGSTYTTSVEIFDELGVSHTVVLNWSKTGANTWDVQFDDPYQTSSGYGSTSTGAIDVDGAGGDTLSIVFNGDGSISTINGAAADEMDFSITGLTATTGSNDITFSFDMGSAGSFDGLTQFSSDESDPDISNLVVEQDGVRYGELSGIEIDDGGLVTAVFDNGVRKAIYQIPIATFSNPAGLTHVQGSIYDENENAGNYSLNAPGDGNAGEIQAGALESSATDTSEEFNKMIIAQQAYSSAAQVVSTVDEMFDSLLSAVR